MENSFTRRAWLASIGSAAVLSNSRAQAASAEYMRGAFIILSTPYTSSKAVDWEDLGSEVNFLDRCGVHGLVWPQLSSELLQLAKEERLHGMEVLAQANRGKQAALVFGVQGDDTDEMLEYASRAEKLAPDALIAIPPKKAKSLDDYHHYFAELCKLTKRPVFIQTSGGAPAVEPTVDFILAMSREFPNFGYVKEEHDPVIARMKALVAKRPDPVKRVFGAHFGNGWLYEMRLGSDGVITGGAMYGDIYARLWNSHIENKMEETRDLYGKLLLMLNLDSDIPGTRLYILKKRGIFKTTVSRQKQRELSAEEIAEVEYRFAALKPYLKVSNQG